ncbi:hypothetical protein [Streptomyces sp. NRRL S-118]|uniref:hypothetical protein n=1 Tax=Streptomyces sp. NRRL S-118 TaxID=1463881 RepID=UPI0004C81CD4|nr:hypothetical protein [Streptomyces sp. NRRL S-118]
MSAWGTAAGAFVGTPVLTTALRAAGEMRLTRMDLPFLLGTAVTVDRTRAKAAGYLVQLPDAQLRTEHARDHRPRPHRLRSHRRGLLTTLGP